MPAIIDSAPPCVQPGDGPIEGDVDDFILQGNYEDCAGIMTFGPGTVYGEEGVAAATGYYVVIWVGAAFMIAAFIAWVVIENRMLIRESLRLRHWNGGGRAAALGSEVPMSAESPQQKSGA